MRKSFILAAAVAAFVPAIAPMAVHAEDNAWIGVRASTLGGGVEIGDHFAPNWSVRLVGNGFDYKTHRTVDDIRYDGKLNMGSFGAQLDWHPMADGPFFLTAGLYDNGNKVRAVATPPGTTDIGGVPFTAVEIGTLNGQAKFKSTAPYLGLGGRWPVGPMAISLEAGAYFQGKPSVTLTNDGAFANDPTFQAQLEVERKDLQHNLNDFSTYPVVSLGLAYRF